MEPRIIRRTIDLAAEYQAQLQSWGKRLMLTGSKGADRLVLTILNNGQTESLTGLSALAYFETLDGDVMKKGQVSGNTIAIDFPDEAYAHKQCVTAKVYVSDGSRDIPIHKEKFDIGQGYGNTLIDPDDIVPNLQELFAQIAATKAAAAAANTAAERANAGAERAEQLQIDASGLAGDSNKLGGKPPEYYLPAVNRLDNSDFRASNFIAQAGFNVPHGSDLYIGDRWMRAANIVPTSIENGIYLSVTDQFSFIQQRVKLTPGTTYTVALKTENGTANRRIAVFNTALNEIFTSVEGGDGVFVATFTAAYETMAILLYPAYAEGGGSSVFQWAALYEGTYTAETLPPYVPKGYAVELAECRRYYRELKYLVARPYNVSASARYYRIALDPPMRDNVNPTVNIVEPIETPLTSWTSTGAAFAVSTAAPTNFTVNATGDATGSDFVLRVDLEICSDL